MKQEDFSILEHPEWITSPDREKKIPNWYISGCDSYDSESGQSLGSQFVFKKVQGCGPYREGICS